MGFGLIETDELSRLIKKTKSGINQYKIAEKKGIIYTMLEISKT